MFNEIIITIISTVKGRLSKVCYYESQYGLGLSIFVLVVQNLVVHSVGTGMPIMKCKQNSVSPCTTICIMEIKVNQYDCFQFTYPIPNFIQICHLPMTSDSKCIKIRVDTRSGLGLRCEGFDLHSGCFSLSQGTLYPVSKLEFHNNASK
jgi:hypothetical protein